MTTGWTMWMTGTGDTRASASATWRDPAQTSSTCANELSQRSGNCPTSHHHSPIVYRPAKKLGPASSANAGSASALTQMRLIG